MRLSLKSYSRMAGNDCVHFKKDMYNILPTRKIKMNRITFNSEQNNY
jgi:hypothetical protein